MTVEDRVREALHADGGNLLPPARPSLAELRSPRRRGRVMLATAGVAVTAAVLALLVLTLPEVRTPDIDPLDLPGVETPGTDTTAADPQQVEVPSVEGLTVEVARDRLDAAGLDGEAASGEAAGEPWADPDGPNPLVVHQEPPPGAVVEPGDVIGFRTAVVNSQLCAALDQLPRRVGDAQDLANQDGYWEAIGTAAPFAEQPLAGHIDQLLAHRAEEQPVAQAPPHALDSVAIHHDACHLPPTAIPTRLANTDVQILAVGATQDPSLKGHTTRDAEQFQFIWTDMANVQGEPPELPDDTIGALAFARGTKSPCRSPNDVVAVEIVPINEQPTAVIVLDPNGQSMGACPNAESEPAWTAYAVAIHNHPTELTGGATTRLAHD